VIGITGAPGAGKSTLTDKLTFAMRQKGWTVGIIAVDPSSPFTGGAVLGDRVRMSRLNVDPGVYIRSMATRGFLGGLTRVTADVVRLLDAFGKDIVIVETVGVGQDEIDVFGIADTTCLILVPGLGDSIQSMKAGTMEIADIFVINKADAGGAGQLFSDTCFRVDQDNRIKQRDWSPPVIKTVAVEDQGIGELVAAIADHRQHLMQQGRLAGRRRERVRRETLCAIHQELYRLLCARMVEEGVLEKTVDDIVNGRIDPYRAMREIVKNLLGRQ
jgi:LAO/AO transport system kinase